METSEPLYASEVVNRYRYAYRVAKKIEGYGKSIEGIGLLLAILLGVATFFGATQIMRSGSLELPELLLMLAIGILPALFVWAFFHFWSVIVSALGEILYAHLDSAVHTSPFLTNDHRATIMALKKTQGS
jgi:hypothetical protein